MLYGKKILHLEGKTPDALLDTVPQGFPLLFGKLDALDCAGLCTDIDDGQEKLLVRIQRLICDGEGIFDTRIVHNAVDVPVSILGQVNMPVCWRAKDVKDDIRPVQKERSLPDSKIGLQSMLP